VTRLGFWRRDPPYRPCPIQPGTVRVTFSGLSNVFKQQDYFRSEFLIVSPFDSHLEDYIRVVATGPGQVGGALPDYSTFGGPITGFKWMPGEGVRFAILGRVAPTVRNVVNHTGNGATFTATFSEQEQQSPVRPYWSVQSITISGDGYGYQDNSRMIVLLEDDSKCDRPVVAGLQTGHALPTLDWSVIPVPCRANAGRGAKLEISYAPVSTSPGGETWRVSAVSVVSGGSGYENGHQLQFHAGAGDVITSPPTAVLSVIDGVIVAVSVTAGGVASKQGVPRSITIGDSGYYYGEDRSLPSIVAADADLSVLKVRGGVPSGGDDDTPKFSVQIDSDVDSETFGHVTDISLADGGDNQLAWIRREGRCAELLNGVTLTLGSPVGNRGGVSICAESSFGTPATFQVELPEDYDNLETGIPGVERLTPGEGLAIRRRVQPVVSVGQETGSGAAFEVYWRRTESPLRPPEWEIYDITATGGSGYGEYVLLSISPATSADKVVTPATARIYQKRFSPNVTVSTSGHGGGARFEVDWEEQVVSGAPPTFRISSVRVIDGGAGYSGRVPLSVDVSAGGSRVRAACMTAHANDRGEVAWASVEDGGSYYRRTSEAGYVDVITKGRYYRETSDVEVADVSVTVRSLFPGHGSGAQLSAVIDDDPDSQTFGTMTAIVDQQGSGYFLNTGSFYRNCYSGSPASGLGIAYRLFFPLCQHPATIRAYPRLELGLARADDQGLDADDPLLLFQADRDAAEELSDTNRSIVLRPLLDGNTGEALIEWGGVADEETQICSCCDVTTAICEDPPESGWPLSDGGIDSLMLVYSVTCRGVNQNQEFLGDNGGPVYYRIIWDEQGFFSSYQYLCGECNEAIEVLGPGGVPFYTTLPTVPGLDGIQRGEQHLTACTCFPDDEEQRCSWDLEIENGCWTGQYVTVDVPCENPLP